MGGQQDSKIGGMEATLGVLCFMLRKKKEKLLLPFLFEQLSYLWVLNPILSSPPQLD